MLFRLAAVGLLMAVAVIGIFLYGPTGKSSFAPLPQPNGYDVLVRGARKIVRSDASIKELTVDQLAGFVATNKEAIDAIRGGLTVPSAVRVEISESWFSVHTRELMDLKAAAVAMNGEALLRSRQGDAKGAVDECPICCGSVGQFRTRER